MGSWVAPRVVLYTTLLILTTTSISDVLGEVLNPPYFNLAERRKITASSTCGEGVDEPELYCKLVGANTDFADNPNINLIYGQVCDYCDPNDPRLAHPAEHAIDGSNNRWQSPPLSRGMSYNEVNLTIDLGQEFHVAYVFIKMGNSPRPGVWVLERSKDNGTTYTPWQYFADTPGDCVQNFGPDSLQPLLKDNTVICETKFSKVVPLEQGEIVVSLLNGRPNADNFSYSPVLQEFTKATNIRLRFLRTKTLLGHLMSVARQDPTVTRRYFYSIKDINIGGRCVCNGHAETCDLQEDPNDPYKLSCRCQHNTCGSQCETCCPDYQQKKWRRAIIDNPFVCEPCNCYEHSDECYYDEKVDQERGSLDIHGHYEGGGVCKNCRHNTEGINCNRCKPTFFRPYGKLLNATDVCQPCNCDLTISTGNCATGSGQCECRPEYLPPYCDDCNVGYYGYPEFCKPCDCHPNGTTISICEVGGGQCPCKPNFGGLNCDTCKEGFFGFPSCTPCDCNPSTSIKNTCNQDDGQCTCRSNYGGRQCDRCNYGFYSYPRCEYCSCDPTGCVAEICDANTGACLCKQGYGGPSCDRCAPGYSGYPNCEECNCNEYGSVNSICDTTGRCHCLPNFSGNKCDQCSPGHYDFPNCQPCNCEHYGSIGVSCDDEGHCYCKDNFDGLVCDRCKENFYNYPLCEECNCNPAGVLPTFLGCGSLTSGELCECKEHVTGRICNECKPLYFNLKISNPLGCEDCNCFPGGTVGGIAVCATTNGQCMCKPNVGSRDCSECRDGKYQLESGDLFGCKDCECDIGGSVNNICDRRSGQCSCRPRITGRNCDVPLHTHYFPTLHQHKFEIEDGRTPVGTQVRYSYDDNVFPGFSWRGYAVFSNLQKEVLLDILIEKPSLYQVFFYYLNFGGENVDGIITFTPETFGDIQQSSDIVFESTTRPLFMKVSGKQGLVASPFVLNPGRWTVSIRVERPLFIDYMVLLPQSYYEATLLQEDISIPCAVSGNKEEMCLMYRYPPFPVNTEIVRGDAGYIIFEEDQQEETNVFDDAQVLAELETQRMALLDKSQEKVHFDFRTSRTGPHIMIVTYHTPRPEHPVTATVEVSADDKIETGSVTFYNCNYSFLCRDLVVNEEGKIAVFDVSSGSVGVVLGINAEGESAIAIDSVALVPEGLYNMDYVVPKPMCIRHEGACKQSEYLPIPESTKVEFESGYNEYGASSHPDGIDTELDLVSLQERDSIVNLHGSVTNPGLYAFIVHYYQPDHPAFDTKVIIQNGEVSNDAKLKFPYCPSVSGCRTVIHAKDTDEMSFQVQKDFHLNIRQPINQTVRIAYVLAIPAKEFHENLLSPLPEDKAGKFIKECTKNSFMLDSDVTGFCREAVFSLTSEYNNGALPCKCDTDGSLSYACEEFGGACQCKPNVIGRTCSQCRTGFFGFPNCKPCDCPSTAYCQPITGQCICPPRVTGDRCDRCVPYTYGFDSIIGCEECSCNHLGTINSNLQCDLQTGQCQCKTNIVGRTCEKCKQGYWAFPHCQLCNCDLRGTTADICEEESARCHCKDNVYGDSCDQCKPGTFYLEEVNPLGCSKCFCFGTTDRCSSGYLFKTQILTMSDWGSTVIDVNDEMKSVAAEVLLYERDDLVQAILPPEMPEGSIFYFKAPSSYLGNKLSSYGGILAYTVYISIDQSLDVESSVGPDLILMGNNLTIVHEHIEQPAGGIPFNIEINLLEHEFHHTSGQEVSREQMMMVLVNLDHLLIRGSYFYPVEEIRLKSVLMDTADENYVADAPQAFRVEQCQCPPSYKGHSCETCAPGYYRSRGPYLGYCVPCQCNGHAQTCDVNTGECIDCKHNTVGKHCEQCAPGYHGDSTQGTPYDCLICACPLPIESNNFAESCEVSPSGQEISCNCKPGYFGDRCEVCSIGFYGSPEIIGSKCNPCECSGNIDSSLPGSCDSVTGDCILCLNNTFGIACELCAPGFHGDAILKKDCEKCDCDICGSRDCDHSTGECICHQNVEGTECDRCLENHWGFNSCAGCRPCNCGPASKSAACDGETGQCPCQPGAAGMTCDICDPGFWQYSTEGCVSCNCDEKYSAGAVCNPVSGICTCLPGVLGDKCDKCPYRWVFLKNQGCFECETCVHGLLDVTDELYEIITPAMEELKDASLSYFANKRLQNVNETADTLRLGVDELLLDPTGLDYSPLVAEVQHIEKLRDALDRSVAHLHAQAVTTDANADDTRIDALEVESIIGSTIGKVKDIIDGLSKLSEGLESSLGPNVDNLVSEAEEILSILYSRNFEEPQNATNDEHSACKDLLEHVKSFELPVLANKDKFVEESEKLMNIGTLLDDLRGNSKKAHGAADDAQALHEELQSLPVKEAIDDLEKKSDSLYEVLKEASDLLDKTKASNEGAENSLNDLASKAERLLLSIRDLKDEIQDTEEGFKDLKEPIREATTHSNFLMDQAALLDSLLADTRESSDAAVKAAKAYANIEEAINDAYEAAQSALEGANQAGSMSGGVLDKTSASKNITDQLLTAALELENQVSVLEPQLQSAKDGVLLLSHQNSKTAKGIESIKDDLDKLPLQSLGVLAGIAANDSAAADRIAGRAREKIEDIVTKLPEDQIRSKEVPKDMEDARQAIKAAHSYADRVASIVPDTNKLIDKAIKKESVVRIIGKDFSEKLAKLRQKVAIARTQASRIKLGVKFFENTTLQLRNPELQKSATYTYMSMYFKTLERFALLAFVGNEKGAHNKMKGVLTDDYLALEIRGGRLVLIMDIGSGFQEIKHDAYVSDGEFHQVIIERTGKTCTITVKGKDVPDSVVEGYLPGTYSVFNLDPKVSKFFIGGINENLLLPDTLQNFHFDGCIEDVIFGETPVGLWDFVKSENNFEGCAEQDAIKTIPSNGLKFSGASSYVILPRKRRDFSSETYIKMSFKTYAKDGLIFLIGKNSDFFALEVEDGHIVLKYDLGSGSTTLKSSEKLNDGKWHSLEATRVDREAILKVDQVEVDSKESPGAESTLSVTNKIFVGGYPKKHSYPGVTHTAYEGCIIDMMISAEFIDLNKNTEALGVANGCPVTVSIFDKILFFVKEFTWKEIFPI
ncbi:hypothetical protein JTE90_005598 [Oedothorax gibbosus]|uniref:Laminin subunit alpha n=1 Tax=Oedothorax gibbosus TaxID=931172 RepID=A0AAV6V9Z6_9ARAC|nr:hypothetical protein JTE90_005598 [Oedothorax gibbosus]